MKGSSREPQRPLSGEGESYVYSIPIQLPLRLLDTFEVFLLYRPLLLLLSSSSSWPTLPSALVTQLPAGTRVALADRRQGPAHPCTTRHLAGARCVRRRRWTGSVRIAAAIAATGVTKQHQWPWRAALANGAKNEIRGKMSRTPLPAAEASGWRAASRRSFQSVTAMAVP